MHDGDTMTSTYVRMYVRTCVGVRTTSEVSEIVVRRVIGCTHMYTHTFLLAWWYASGLHCVTWSSCMSVPSLLLQGMTVENAPRLSIRRPNALVVKGSQQEHYIAFESKEQRAEWAKVRVCNATMQ